MRDPTVNLARREHDDRYSDDNAAEFIRAAMLPGETSAVRSPEPAMAEDSGWITQDNARWLTSLPSHRDRVQDKGGIRHVALDGMFRDVNLDQEDAPATAAILKMSLR